MTKKLAAALACMAFCTLQSVAWAQPAGEPLRILVPLAAGGGVDAITRIIARELEGQLHRPVVVENRTGGNGVVATTAVARAKPDGNTLIMVGMSHAVNPSLVDKLPYDTARDLAEVTMVATSPLVLLTHAQAPYKNVAELIAYARKNPGAVTYGIGGTGSSSHMAGLMFSAAAGITMEPVAYQGTAVAYPDLISGRLPLLIDNSVIPVRMENEGKVRLLAVTTPKRSTALPRTPTLAESGLAGYDVGAWFGVVAPGGTPAATLAQLAQAINATLKSEQVREAFKAQGMEPVGSTPAEFSRLVDVEIQRWAQVVKPPAK